MIIKIKRYGQINLPKEVMDNLCLKEGDMLNLTVKEDDIILSTASIYPNRFYNYIEEQTKKLQEQNKDLDISSPEELIKAIYEMVKREN